MRIVHQSALDSYSQPSDAKILLLAPPSIAALLPATTAANYSSDHQRRVHAAAAPLLDTAVQYLDGQVNEAAVLTAFSRFYNQIVKSAPTDQAQPSSRPRFRTKEEMDADIAKMVDAARERLYQRQQEIQEELRTMRHIREMRDRSIFS